MVARAFERVQVNLDIRFNLWNPLNRNSEYLGKIKNISEKGLLINTNTPYFPYDSPLKIYLLVNKEILLIPVKYNTIRWRRLVSYNFCDRIGVELLNPPQAYYEHVQRIKAVGNY